MREGSSIKYFLGDLPPELRAHEGAGVLVCSRDGKEVRLHWSGSGAAQIEGPQAVTPLQALQTATRQLASFSHDLGGGLTSVLAAMDVLDDVENREEQAEMKEAMSRQLQVIAELMRVRRMLAFPLRVELEEVDVREALEEVLATFRGLFQRSLIHLGWVFGESELRWSGDAGALQCAVGHLLMNACEASARGSSVRLEAREFSGGEGRWLVISVLDAGCGLPRERLGQLGQLGAFASHNRMGSGLFSVAQAVAELRGALLLRERASKGTEAHLAFRL